MSERRQRQTIPPATRPPPPAVHILRCTRCHRVLAHVTLTPGSVVEIRCRSCTTINSLKAS